MKLKEKKELFSKKIVAGRRTYLFNVKESQDGSKYLVISELKRVKGYEYHHDRIMIFKEHIPSFVEGLKEALEFIKKKRDKAKAYDVEEIRKKYAKAYAKWTSEEDNILRNEYLLGKTVDELATDFQRKPGAILSRLRKMGLLGKA